MTQLYLVKISAMNTSDDCDIVPSAEIVVDSDFCGDNGPIIPSLQRLAVHLAETIKSAPVENLRPMTREEIKVYRDALKAEETDSVRLI